MLRSMYSGISGMKNFQTKLDVIGNNIANVNTFGFKKGRVVFQDLYSQSISGASAPGGTRGGTNPRQVGLGSQLASIDTIQNGGSLQTTGRTLDLAISGDGFFQVAESDVKATSPVLDTPKYTRAGNFYMDSNGYLVNGDGLYLVGFSNPNNPDLDTAKNVTDYKKDATKRPIMIPTNAKSMSIGSDGSVTFVDAAGVLKWGGVIDLAKFPNPAGLEKAGGNLYSSNSNSGTAVTNSAGLSGIGSIQSGSLEMSNVDLSEEFTEMIVAQRGFQANTKIITTSDEILQELVNLKR